MLFMSENSFCSATVIRWLYPTSNKVHTVLSCHTYFSYFDSTYDQICFHPPWPDSDCRVFKMVHEGKQKDMQRINASPYFQHI